MSVLICFLITDHSIVSPICLPWYKDDPGRILNKTNMNPPMNLMAMGWGRSTKARQPAKENLEKCGARTCKLQEWEEPSNNPNCKRDGYTNGNGSKLLCLGGKRG